MELLEDILKNYKSEEIATVLAKRGHRIFLDDVNYTIKVEPPTEKQLSFIEKITMQLGVVFEGKTLTEAAQFINENISYLESLPSTKQMKTIKVIEDTLDIKFKGNTMKEASEFISEHIEKSKSSQRKRRVSSSCSSGGYDHDCDPHWGFVSPYDIYDEYDMPTPF